MWVVCGRDDPLVDDVDSGGLPLPLATWDVNKEEEEEEDEEEEEEDEEEEEAEIVSEPTRGGVDDVPE